MISDREAIRWSGTGESKAQIGKVRSVRRNLPPCRFSPIIIREPERQKGVILSPDWERGVDDGEKFDRDLPDGPDSGDICVHHDKRGEVRTDRSVGGGAERFNAWPKETWEQVRDLYASGLTVSEIAQRIGKSEETIAKKMKRMGYKRVIVHRRKVGPRKWTPERIAIIRAMAAEGKYITDIAEEFGVRYDTIRAVMREHGIVCKYRTINPTYWTPEEKAALRKMREEGVPAKDISRVLNKSIHSIYKQAWKQGLK